MGSEVSSAGAVVFGAGTSSVATVSGAAIVFEAAVVFKAAVDSRVELESEVGSGAVLVSRVDSEVVPA